MLSTLRTNHGGEYRAEVPGKDTPGGIRTFPAFDFGRPVVYVGGKICVTVNANDEMSFCTKAIRLRDLSIRGWICSSRFPFANESDALTTPPGRCSSAFDSKRGDH
jgi:hypothetical protein